MYDLIVIGAGPAGYVGAEHAARMGKKVLLLERDRLGGTCLNCGCIPTKSFLNSAKLYAHARHSEAFGVRVKEVEFDYGVMQARTQKIQETLRNGIAGMMKRHKVEVLSGEAVCLDPNRVEVAGKVYQGSHLLIATGSRPIAPPIPGLADNPRVVDSTGILARPELAEHLLVIGGGVIGIEFASFYSLLGRKVTVIEMLPKICGALDSDLSSILQRKLESRGCAIHLNAKVEKLEGGKVHFTDASGKAVVLEADLVLSAAGRRANLEGFGLENLNLARTRAALTVNEQAQTSVHNVYAAGDLTGRVQLAHFASRQAIVAVHNMFGVKDICREEAIPGVIYGDPELAGVGLSEAQAKERGGKYRVVKMPLAASGRFLAETEGERGLVKAVLGERDEVIGLHVAGSYASEMIGAAALMIELELRASDVQEVVFPHPTVAEIMKEVMFS
ncbi:MAG: dihydrolipoyl dehydrogenase [Planctomycetota bacterium]|jgi:dihydrolipoamide dehydrogenase|nr:dihydrolipoyl dehydrogenase [Planctomycetota bacterium]